MTVLAEERVAPLHALLVDLGDVPVVRERTVVRRRSRDFFWYSPILNAELSGKSADLIVQPRDEADVIRIAAACARHRVPLTPRGGGTGNYGQAVPLHGGVLLDMTGLDRIEWSRPGLVRVGPGLKMHDLDAALRPSGFELRMHPSTKRTATIGGFVAGGSGGVGSVTYGGLREPGNIVAARIVTLEEEPRVLELRGDAAQKINRAYGTTGIITALEMPLAPAWPWIDLVVAFDSFMEAAALRARGGARRRHRQEASDARELAPAGLLRPAEGRLPGGPGDSPRHGRRAVARKFSGPARRARDDHPRGARATRAPARSRSTSTPGTTPPCRCSRRTAASPTSSASTRTTGSWTPST